MDDTRYVSSRIREVLIARTAISLCSLFVILSSYERNKVHYSFLIVQQKKDVHLIIFFVVVDQGFF